MLLIPSRLMDFIGICRKASPYLSGCLADCLVYFLMRYKYIDTLKAIGILFVYLGHYKMSGDAHPVAEIHG